MLLRAARRRWTAARSLRIGAEEAVVCGVGDAGEAADQMLHLFALLG